MTEPRVTLTAEPPARLWTLEVWSALSSVAARFMTQFGVELPSPLRSAALESGRILWTEPQVWIVTVPLAHSDIIGSRLNAVLADDGALTDVTGAYARLSIVGPDWRALMMVGGVFNAEDPAFSAGHAIATVIDHAPVRLDVVGSEQVTAWTAPSYSADLFAFWREAASRLDPV